MERNERQAQERAMLWRTLEALTMLIDRVHDPEARRRLEKRRRGLYDRLKRG